MDTRFAIEDCQFTVNEAAEHLKVSRAYLYSHFIATGTLKVAKLGSRTVVPGKELKRLIGQIAKSAA